MGSSLGELTDKFMLFTYFEGLAGTEALVCMSLDNCCVWEFWAILYVKVNGHVSTILVYQLSDNNANVAVICTDIVTKVTAKSCMIF